MSRPASHPGTEGIPERILIDGRERDAISAIDRGLHYGDGLFETLVCRGGAARFLDLHLERLERGCRRLALPFHAFDTLRGEIQALAGERESCLLKLIVTRGAAAIRGYGTTGDEQPVRLLLRYALDAAPDGRAASGVRVRLATLRLAESPALAGLKHLNRLENVLARSEWHDPRIAEALLFAGSGRLVSGTMSNVFVVIDNRLATPRLERCGVAGVMRRVVLREARRAGIEAGEEDLEAAALEQAEEIFLTNVRIGIWPVRALEGRELVPGPLTRRLQSIVEDLDA